MAAKYIKSSSDLSPKSIWTKLESGEWSFDNCPWVVLGDVYASVTFTGDGSWQEIVKDLHSKGQEGFTVLAGRHGDQLGQQVDLKTGKFKTRDPKDAAIDPADDQKIATALNGNKALKGINIKVIDAGGGNHDSVEKVKREIKSQLDANRIVVLAWCYSLYAMKEGWDEKVKTAWPEVFKGPNITPISHTAKDWSWATSRKSPASIAAEEVAVS